MKRRKRETCLADYPQFHEARALAVERGRTIGRLDALSDRCDRFVANGVKTEAESIVSELIPILRAEIERLRTQT